MSDVQIREALLNIKHRFGAHSNYDELELALRFKELVSRERKLLSLAVHIDTVMGIKHYDTQVDFNLWFGDFGYKQQMNILVGIDSTNEAVKTNADYDIAYTFLYFYLIEERALRTMSLDEIRALPPGVYLPPKSGGAV
jgi:hypothetical protein